MHERSLWNWTSNTDTVWSFYMEEKIDYFIGVFINKLHGEETERQSCFDFRIIYGFARFQYNRLALCWNIPHFRPFHGTSLVFSTEKILTLDKMDDENIINSITLVQIGDFFWVLQNVWFFCVRKMFVFSVIICSLQTRLQSYGLDPFGEIFNSFGQQIIFYSIDFILFICWIFHDAIN